MFFISENFWIYVFPNENQAIGATVHLNRYSNNNDI